MKINPKSTIVIPIGAGVTICGLADDFDNGITGIIYRALPDDLAYKGELGQPLTEEQVDRVNELEDAPTLFLHAASPEALLLLAQQADDLACAWGDHLYGPDDSDTPIYDTDTLLAVAEMIAGVGSWGLTESQIQAVEKFRQHLLNNLKAMADGARP